MRPLSFTKKDDMICICSESSLYQDIGFDNEITEIKPGEVVKLFNNEIVSLGTFTYHNNYIRQASCGLEYAYLSNDNSLFNNILIKDARYNFGVSLWEEEEYKSYIQDNFDDFVVSYIPNTAINSAIGYSESSGIELIDIIKVNFKDRTFIISNQEDRMKALLNKFTIQNITNKRKLILIDDSIVRGNTIIILVFKLLCSKQFDEIYIRSASPPIRYEDYMGIDIPTREELIANYTINKNIYLYLSINNEKLKESIILDKILYDNRQYVIYLSKSDKEESIPIYTKYYKYYFKIHNIECPKKIYDLLDSYIDKYNIHMFGNEFNEKDLTKMFGVTNIKYLSENGFINTLNKLSGKENIWNLSWTNNNYPIEFEDTWEHFKDII